MIFVSTRTGKITNNIFAVNAIMVNMFIVKYGEDTICIDTGMGSNNIKRGLKKLDIDPDAISHVFLTHSDYDHTGCIDLFMNADIFLSRKEEQMITGKTRRSGGRYNSPINRKYTLLDEGESVQIGNISVKGIETPGHTPGSMSYLVNGEYLFVGDTLALIGNKAHNFPSFINMDTSTERESITKLSGLRDIKMMFTAHSGYTSDFSHAMNKWKDL